MGAVSARFSVLDRGPAASTRREPWRMPMAKKKQESPFTGLWHVVSMSGWDEDYFNEEVQAFIELEANGTGHFQFGYVHGYMDWRPAHETGSQPSSGPGKGRTGPI